jgi:Spy/CpxP family protein refolding chaperone
MTKLVALIAAGSFAATTLFAGEHGEGMLKVQNEKKEMKMACTISLANLNLTPQQRKKMDAAMAAHMKTGCTEASEAKYMAQAKAVMTPEQYTKFKEEYDRAPQMKM